MSRLERLIYGSTATGRTDSLINLVAILAESQRNNDRDGLTGALAAHEGRYVQVIEGRSDALDGLLRRLATDNRHRDIVVFSRDPIEARAFSGWGMASARITPAVKGLLDDLMANQTPSPARALAIMREAVAAV
jgi:hypothetical protein